ncbi:MAG: type VI secretion system tip protein TssI/VgrG [Pseudomonadota bacterium]
MAFTVEDKFSFVSRGMPDDAFGVVSFSGSEGLSRCYVFNIDLVSDNPDIDLAKVLQSQAVFTIRRADGDIPFNGIPAGFEQLHAFGPYVFYRVVLVPKLWWLSLTHHNQVFLNQGLPEILDAVLKDGGLTNLDFELRLKKSYPNWEYICQYRESHLEFVTRWMERDGLYFFFEQTPRGEKVIITDTNMAHTPMPEGRTLLYSPPSGLDSSAREEVIHAFSCRQRLLPQRIELKDYNYRTPSLEVSGKADVLPADGRGLVYLYGEHFRTPEEGTVLAKVRAEEYLCRERLFVGESLIPYLRPGYVFELTDHYRDDFNQPYLTTDLDHRGSQVGYLLAGIQGALSERERTVFYHNSFTAMPGRVQFRPERKTPKARFFGGMNARIDSSGSGQYAELDEQGRYKVILPFDLSGRENGKASCFLRMAQPYCGSDHGMHFPLHKGTEVLLTFIDGDPDRPVITGAVPNPQTPSVVDSKNQTKCAITTSGQNRIHMEDEEGNQRILLHTPTAGTFIRIGSPNDPPPAKSGPQPGETEGTGNGVNIYTAEGVSITAATLNKFIIGETTTNILGGNSQFVLGADNKTVVDWRFDTTIGIRLDFKVGGSTTFDGWHIGLRPKDTKMKGDVTKLLGAVQTLAGETTKLAGATTKLAGETSMLAGSVTKLTGDVADIAGETSCLAGEMLSLNGDVTALKGSETSMNAECVRLSANMSDLCATHAKIIGEQTSILGEATQMAGNETKLVAESTELAALKAII